MELLVASQSLLLADDNGNEFGSLAGGGRGGGEELFDNPGSAITEISDGSGGSNGSWLASASTIDFESHSVNHFCGEFFLRMEC